MVKETVPQPHHEILLRRERGVEAGERKRETIDTCNSLDYSPGNYAEF